MPFLFPQYPYLNSLSFISSSPVRLLPVVARHWVIFPWIFHRHARLPEGKLLLLLLLLLFLFLFLLFLFSLFDGPTLNICGSGLCRCPVQNEPDVISLSLRSFDMSLVVTAVAPGSFFLWDPPNAINDMTGGHVESSSVRGIPWYTSVPNNHWDIHIVDPVEDPIASVSTSFIAGRYCRYSTSIEGWFVIGTFILYAIVGGKRQTLRWRISRTSESPGPNAQVCTFPDVILYPLVI